MSDLTLTFDPGSSLSKVIYHLADGRPRLLLMEPEVIELSLSSIDAHLRTRGNLGITRPEDDVWLQCSDSQQCQVVGYLARQFLAAVRMNEVKYERALYKVLAAVGAIVQHMDLPRKFSIAISALLPYGEYQNAQRFQQLLKQHLKNYSFRGERLQVKLAAFECRPEGGGLAMARVMQNGAEWFQQQTLAVLMFGHRNTSLLLFERGKLAIGNTTDLGFHQLVDKVLNRTSGQSADSLTSAIYSIGNQIAPDNPQLQHLVKTRSPTEQKLEREQIVTAILTAREEYWSRLQDWLDTMLPNVTEVIISGGAALYLHDELESYFNRTPTYWGTDLQQRLQDLLGLDYRSNRLDADVLSFRLIDVFGMYCDFVEQLAEGRMNEIAQTSRKREDFSFRYSPYTDTPDGVLTAFLKKGDGVRQGKELMLESARAFWMVAAHQAEGLLSQEELRQLGLSCCRALERQSDYIRECLQLPIPSAESSTIEYTNGDRQNGSNKPADRATRTMWQ